MTKQMMIDKIYEKIADKTLSFWCMISVKLWWENKHFNTVIIDTEYRDNYILYKTRHPLFELREVDNTISWDVKIIWHPVMLADVIDWFISTIDRTKNEQMSDDFRLVAWDIEVLNIISYWKDKRKPIEEQPDTLIESVYNLLP